MNLIVADTGPLNYLVLIEEVEILSKLCTIVFVPQAVWTELQHEKTPDPVKSWVRSPPAWLKVRSPSVSISSSSLQLGESQAISLALELGAPILVDDAEARFAAQNQGLNVLGTIGILELGAFAGFIDLEAALTRLQRTSHRNTPELINAALDRLRQKARQNQ